MTGKEQFDDPILFDYALELVGESHSKEIPQHQDGYQTIVCKGNILHKLRLHKGQTVISTITHVMTNKVSPKHPRASHFKKSGLFERLTTFTELESRIAELPTTKEMGDAFEVFAEAYLSTQKQVQAVEVWPDKSIPTDVEQQLHLPSSDKGIDGVFREVTGDYSAYQVKFRTGRPSLSWKELSTFFGLSDLADTRVLITNGNDLAEVVASRVRFYCVRGNDLDRLEPRDFELIIHWLKGVEVPRHPKTPRPYQAQAIQKIAHGLESHDRVTAVMACGTGKTLIALWLAEQLECRQILVLVPSLALMRQTLHEWLKETSADRISYRCICSDPTVSKDLDGLSVHQSDLDFPVNTNSEELAEYLAQPFDGVRVIFSTYQSAHVVAQALEGRNLIDLGVFDEAHKTAGRQGTRFSFAIEDKNLPIKKRVFLTATPRHYDVTRRDKEGDAKLVFSMDVPESYGPIAHSLSFAEAERMGIICGYKVIISVVTTEMVADALNRRGEVIVECDAIKTRQIANQIAIEQAVREHGIKRIFTFHSTVASAKSFVATGGEGVGAQLSGFSTFHVNGKIPTTKREDILGEFFRADCGLVSNARCLTEGVDLPSVDMVAFMSPKKSKVDIVQATGRAMRKDPENSKKDTGFILLPLFVESSANESLEDALKRTDYEEVWNVLEAMQEQDEVLHEIIQQMQVEKGRTGGFDDSRYRDKIEVLGPSVSVDQLRTGIAVCCIERLAVTWDFRYGELQRFKVEHGNCNVPSRWPDNPQLNTWIGTQRKSYKNGQLSNERIERLETLGFVWDMLEVAWEEKFAAIQDYKAKHGNCNVPPGWPDNPQLNTWIHNQRGAKTSGKLSYEKIERLEAIGFDWDQRKSAWEEMFALLQKYKAINGDCNVLRNENLQLAGWVMQQRRSRKNIVKRQKGRGFLSPEQIVRLEVLGFDWDPLKSAWEEKFTLLQEYKAENGNCNVPQEWPDNPILGKWVISQRINRRKDKLTPAQIQRLENIGFDWDPAKTVWEKRFGELHVYRTEHGHCDVPIGWEENRQLAQWVSQQRSNKRRKRGKLCAEQIVRLGTIGFDWDPWKTAWEEMFTLLQKY